MFWAERADSGRTRQVDCKFQFSEGCVRYLYSSHVTFPGCVGYRRRNRPEVGCLPIVCLPIVKLAIALAGMWECGITPLLEIATSHCVQSDTIRESDRRVIDIASRWDANAILRLRLC